MKILSYPLVLLSSLLLNIYKDFSGIFERLLRGETIPFGMVGDLFKEVVLVAIIMAVLWWLIRFTVERALPESLNKKNFLTFLGNLIFGVFILVIFYVIFAIVLYTFSYYLAIIKLEIDYKPQNDIILK